MSALPTMTRLARMVRGSLPLAWVALALVSACGDADESGLAGSSTCFGPQCVAADAGDRDSYVVDTGSPEGGMGMEGGLGALSPLCGTGCLPDDPAACAESAPEAGLAMDGGAHDAGGDAADDAADAGSAPGDDGAEPRPAPPVYGCRVQSVSGSLAGVCEPAGAGLADAPCATSADCAPGFGCVGAGAAGQCRAFCCAGECDTGAGEFCAERPLRGAPDPSAGALRVPVCVPADHCNLAEPYPCVAASAEGCTCSDPATACMVVGTGTTACVPPGTGKVGEPCPCAWGEVCSRATGTCLQICSLTLSDSGCGAGKCQSSKELPGGFGVCVGGAGDAG
ncbi:MAG: hypothetical protein OZ921_12560 [Sorangiineae bacterium]|nr:hypothetical protein [Polyangiaceae bacterium]MEB2323338.1 hypothetical protein [Sorangiineae bacterium]